MKKLRVGVIGFGYWGPNLVRNFLTIPAIEQISICDVSETQRKRAHSMFPQTTIYENADYLFHDTSIDVIAIATPVGTHYELAKKALTSGKHVILEKPMTTSSKKAVHLIALAKKNKKQLFVGHTFVYSEPIRYLKKLIDTNVIGNVYYFDSARINLGLLQSDTNVLWDLAPHDFSIISYLFKEKPISIYAFGSSFLRDKVEELVHIFVNLENNISCHIQLSWLSPIKMRNIILAGSKKMATYDDIQPIEKIRVYDKGVSFNKHQITPFAPAYRSGDITIPSLKQTEALSTELNHFVSCVLNNTNPITGGQEGLEVVRLIEAAEKSLRMGKKVYLHAKK